MTDKYCDRHFEDKSLCERDKERVWEALDNKISLKWLFILIPIFMTWISFQIIIYDSLKNLETKVAVIEQRLPGK